jgi:hypothetical protein
METREELISKYADTCVMLRNAELSRSKQPEEEKSFMDKVCDNKWKILTGLIAVGGAAGTAYCYRDEIKDYLEKDDNIFKDVNEFLSTNTGKAIVGVVTAGSTTAVKSNFTSNQTNILKKMTDSELTPEFNYYRKLNPFNMSETELEYNITLMEGIIGSYKPTVGDIITNIESPTIDTDSIKEDSDVMKMLTDKAKSVRNMDDFGELVKLIDKCFPDSEEDDVFMLTEN